MNIKQIQEILKFSGFSHEAQIQEILTGGSNRKFYRIKENKNSAVLIQNNPHDSDFAQYIEIADFLKGVGIGVPEIYHVDRKKKLILEEDLGDLTLEKHLKNTCKDDSQITTIYKQVIDTLILMQITGGKKINQCKCLKEKIFDYNTFRFETKYFTEYFLEMYCGLKINKSDIEDEFHKLAMKLVSEPLYFMHRDFQSQNILIKDKKIRIIDFQSAYQGLLAYDLASLLKDAYISIEDELQNKLIDYYLDSLNKYYKININPHKFHKTFLYAGLQRNTQALGAFSFLSLMRHKLQFKQYIPQALKYLCTTLNKTHEFPKLTKVVTESIKKNLTSNQRYSKRTKKEEE